MSERKVLNKYYPPDFDPSKIPRARCPKNRQFTVRLMAPCNMKCLTCGEYIAKGKKFNSRKEDVEDQFYLGIRIYRFYIKCPGCLSEISFRTDPESTDYVIEAGAHRNFQALKLAEEQAEREEREAKEEIESNPMLLLENRTQQSQREMEVLESLEDLREMSERHAGLDLAKMAQKYEQDRQLSLEEREEAEHLAALTALGYELINGEFVKKVPGHLLDDEEKGPKRIKYNRSEKGTDILTKQPQNTKGSVKNKFSGLVKFKNTSETTKDCTDYGKAKDQSLKLAANDDHKSVNNANGMGEKECQELIASNIPTTSCSEVNKIEKLASSGLSLLGSYSDSDESS